MIDRALFESLLARVQHVFSDWSGVDDPRFVENEVAYKRAAIATAQEMLSEPELRRLLEEGSYDELLDRLDKVGKSTNLLYLAVPMQGDLGILYQPDLDKPGFCRAVLDLLYGVGPSEERLGRYVAYVESQGLPNKWTFPTYLLFLCHPDEDMFVKPSVIRWFLDQVGLKDRYHHQPSGELYATIKALAQELSALLEPYGAQDMVHVQSFLYACYAHKDYGGTAEDEPEASFEPQPLAEPFASIFADWDEAWWAFDLMAQGLEGLGVTDLEDLRYAVTTRQDGRTVRLIAGDRVSLGFRRKLEGTLVELGLAIERIDEIARYGTEHRRFVTWGDFPDMTLFDFPLEVVRHEQPAILDVYRDSLRAMEGWQRSYQISRLRAKHHRPEIAAGIVDPDARRRVLSGGVELGEREEDGYFSEETFDLLAQLHEDPTKAFYQAHKDAFSEQLEEPFKRLFADVAARLPQAITDRMETEKHVFSRIPKNDYGRGGAWPFFWGALYPRGSKRIADAQLFIGIHRDCLEFGFYLGELGDEPRRRFHRNLPRYRSLIAQALEETLAAEPLGYGERDATTPSLAEWAASSVPDPRAAIRLTPEEAIEYTSDELAQRIASVFAGLYPLVLLTLEEDPTRSVHAYLDWDEEEEQRPIQPAYPLGACAEATGFPIGDLQSWVAAIHRKKQAIFYGPPGTGKTFLAKELARHLVEGGDGFVDLVQFHPAYAYEDFIQGIRPQQAPDGNGLDYPVLSGRFLRFCREAAQRRGICVLIIDEINRANLARVFGELMYLLEYRDERVTLAVSGDEFSIPANVRLLGTMNTADRSIALVDHALRRRFAFIGLYPRYEVLTSWHARNQTGLDPTGLIAVLQRLNRAIDDRDYAVGISFFLVPEPATTLPSVWRMEIEPYLEEFFFDQRDTVEQFRWDRISDEVLGS